MDRVGAPPNYAANSPKHSTNETTPAPWRAHSSRSMPETASGYRSPPTNRRPLRRIPSERKGGLRRHLPTLIVGLLLCSSTPAQAFSHGQIVAWRQITLVFPKHYQQAHRVALCESGLTARADNGQYHGIFQLSASWRGYFGIGGGFNPYMNIRAAHKIYRGQGWQPWECQPW